MWTAIHFIVRFFQDLWHAAFFSALEYDDKLKLTKTPQQRFLIWFMVVVFIIIGCMVLIMFIRTAVESMQLGNIYK
jgi:uncharacterized membrane protein YwzB